MAEAKEEKSFITPEEYFQMDDASEEKLTFYRGEIFAMVGARFEHNQICTNIGAHFNTVLPESCFIVGAAMRVQVEEETHYTYPDIAVVCGPPEFLDAQKRNTLLNPVLIAEVLSKSTQSFDRGDKFASYRKIDTLKHYLLVDQYAVHIEHFYKNTRGHWELAEKHRLDDVLELTHIACDLPVREIYRRIDLDSG